MQKITTFLMFDGKAEEAIKFYVSLFKGSRVDMVARYGPEQKEMQGKVVHAEFNLAGQWFMAMDSAVKHKFSFTPSTSLYVACQSEAEIDTLYKKLVEGGAALMELAKYPFAEKYGWVNDKYGVSWQLILAKGK
jgi:predicted 3-demethylubiquinone-9 3-methyltransferase (glyoxalase superfamily)